MTGPLELWQEDGLATLRSRWPGMTFEVGPWGFRARVGIGEVIVSAMNWRVVDGALTGRQVDQEGEERRANYGLAPHGQS